MTQTEYEQKEQKKLELYREIMEQDPTIRLSIAYFEAIFDRAYALGKQENDTEDGSLWSRLTDEEKREMQCRYHTNKCVLRDHRKRTGDKAQSKAVARMKLLENLFGKENLKNHSNG